MPFIKYMMNLHLTEGMAGYVMCTVFASIEGQLLI